MMSTMAQIEKLQAELERKLEEKREIEEEQRIVQLAAAHDAVVMVLNRVVYDPVGLRQVRIVELELPGNEQLRRLVSVTADQETRNYREEIEIYATILQLQKE